MDGARPAYLGAGAFPRLEAGKSQDLGDADACSHLTVVNSRHLLVLCANKSKARIGKRNPYSPFYGVDYNQAGNVNYPPN